MTSRLRLSSGGESDTSLTGTARLRVLDQFTTMYSSRVAGILTPIGRAVALFMARKMPRAANLIAHYHGAPRRHELSQAGTWTDLPECALTAQGLTLSASHRHEVDDLLEFLRSRLAETKMNYPNYYGAAESTVAMIALISVADDILSVAETGVADGRTSLVLLETLRGRDGRLCSIDIARNVGSLIADRTGWDLRITDGSSTAVRRIVRDLGRLDMFIHDSDHQYIPQLADLEIGWDALRPGGWLVADDADWSYACRDFATKTRVKPSFLYNPTNVAMVMRKPFIPRSE